MVGLTTLLLTGCGGDGSQLARMTPAELLALHQTGRPVLDCREACLPEWRDVQPEAMELDARQQWSDLAVLVMRTGYQDDLSLYYLGRAAEGMKFFVAAASYYRQSMQLSGTSISCENFSRLCGGVNLPAAAEQRLAATDSMLAAAKPPRRPRPNPSPARITLPTLPEPDQAGPPVVPVSHELISPSTDGPAAGQAETTPLPAPAIPGRAEPAPRPDADYIEPPPAPR